jgi:hypothetical protein
VFWRMEKLAGFLRIRSDPVLNDLEPAQIGGS